MSSRPPPDAAPEGSYWVAELSGIPSSISIDQLSRPPYTWGLDYGAQWIARKEASVRSIGLGFKTWDELLIAIHGLNGIEVKKWNSVVGTSFAFNDIHYFSAEGESLLTHKDPGNRIWYMRSSTFKGPSLPVGATSGVPGQPQLQNPASRFFRAASQAPTLHAQPHPPPPPQQQQMLPPAPPSRPLANDYGAAYPTYRPSPSAQQSNFSDSPPSPKRVRSNSHGSGAFGDAEFGPVKEEGDDGAAAGLLLQDRRSSIDVSSQGYMPANKHDGRGGGEHGGGGGGGVRGGGDRHLFVEGLPYDWTWQQVKDLFRSAGAVIRADIVRSREGASTGQASIMFDTPTDAHRARDRFNGYLVYGNPLKVDYDRFVPIISPGYRGPSSTSAGSGGSRSSGATAGPSGVSVTREREGSTSGSGGARDGRDGEGKASASRDSAGDGSTASSPSFYRGNSRDQRPALEDGRIHLINLPHGALSCEEGCSVSKLVVELVQILPSIRPLDIAHISVHDITDAAFSISITLADNNQTYQLSRSSRRTLGGNARDTLYRRLGRPLPMTSGEYRKQLGQQRA